MVRPQRRAISSSHVSVYQCPTGYILLECRNMTRKDFELIARTVREARPIAQLDSLKSQAARNGVIGANSALDSFASNLADELKARYPSFNKARFIEACKAVPFGSADEESTI